MSYVFAAPELVDAAAQNLAGIRSALGQATHGRRGSDDFGVRSRSG